MREGSENGGLVTDTVEDGGQACGMWHPRSSYLTSMWTPLLQQRPANAQPGMQKGATPVAGSLTLTREPSYSSWSQHQFLPTPL